MVESSDNITTQSVRNINVVSDRHILPTPEGAAYIIQSPGLCVPSYTRERQKTCIIVYAAPHGLHKMLYLNVQLSLSLSLFSLS